MSKSITIENYEEFALDFIEGTLSPEMHRSFEAFLLLHPAIAEEMESMQAFELPALDAELSEEFKQNLKIEITPTAGIDESNYEESFALAVDQDLNPELAKNALHFVDANPALASDFIAYQRTKVKPNLSIVYTNKGKLKQPVTLWASYSTPVLRVAAAIAVIIGLATALTNSQQEIYRPRLNEGNQYSAIQIEPISTSPKKTNASHEVESNDKVINVPAKGLYIAQTQTPQKTDVAPIEPINVDEVIQQNTPVLPEERYMADGSQNTPSEKESGLLLNAANTGKTTVLNLTQFIGQRFFGIEPNKAETPKDLIKESLNTFVDKNELLAVSNEGDKRTFTIAGGRFEYTKVAHR